MPVAGLPLGLWSPHNDLQSLQSLVSSAHLATHTASPCRGRLDRATASIDATYVKAHRSAHGGKGGRRRRLSVFRVAVRPQKSMSRRMFWGSSSHPAHTRQRQRHPRCRRANRSGGPRSPLIADRGYDANSLRLTLRSIGTIPVIPGRRSRKRPIRHDERRYRDRWRIEAAFCRLKDFRRVATRYDKLAVNFLSAVVLAAIVAFWV